jgi:hypothetical protein
MENSSNTGKLQQPPLDYTKIDASIFMSWLSKTWDDIPGKRPYVLPKLPYIIVDKRSPQGHMGPFKWFDLRTGVSGVGAIELVSHILKIDKYEAARRLAVFMWPVGGGAINDRFLLVEKDASDV